MHSASSQCSSTGRPRTKAALKGYEGLKVSIPTSGIDLQQALERSPNSNGCKLSALAEIALGTDAPIVAEAYRSKYLSPVQVDMKTGPTIDQNVQHKEQKSPVKAEVSKPEIIQKERSSKSREPSPKKPSAKESARVTSNRLGFKERKKRPTAKSKSASSKKSDKMPVKMKASNLPKDIYDFEESADSNEGGAIKPLTHVRTIDDPRKRDGQDNELVNSKVSDAEEESTYSDRDGFFNYNSVDSSISDEDDESDTASVMTRKSTKTPATVQKKCLIMGRIFKNAKKDPEPVKPAKTEKKREVIKSMVKKQMNEIFDDLREQERRRSGAMKRREEAKCGNSSVENQNDDDEDTDSKARASSSGRSRKSREIISLEAEWGMSIEEVKDLIGVGRRKAQRRCAANQQKKFVETWSSDEYEDFHSSKDIIAMIKESEVKAERTKTKSTKTATTTAVTETKAPAVDYDTVKEAKTDSVKESKKTKPKSDTKKVTTFSGVQSEDSDFESDWNRSAKRAKIKNRRRTIAFQEDVYEEDEKVPAKARRNKKDRSPPPPPKKLCNQHQYRLSLHQHQRQQLNLPQHLPQPKLNHIQPNQGTPNRCLGESASPPKPCTIGRHPTTRNSDESNQTKTMMSKTMIIIWSSTDGSWAIRTRNWSRCSHMPRVRKLMIVL